MTKNKTNKQASTNVQESEDLGRMQANKFLTEIAIEATESAEKSIRMGNLKDKLIDMWITAPEERDSTELRTEIDIACNAGESAMEGLLSKLIEERQTDGNAEESIMNKPLKLTNDERDELERKKKDFRQCKLIDKLVKLPDVPGLLRAEVKAASLAGEDVMEEMLFKLMGTVQTDADVTNVDRDKLKKDGLRAKLLKIEHEVALEVRDACRAGENAIEELSIKLMGTVQTDADVTNVHRVKAKMFKLFKIQQVLSDEVRDAYADGESAMEELLIKMLDMQQTAGSGEESINVEHARARVVSPTPTQQKR